MFNKKLSIMLSLLSFCFVVMTVSHPCLAKDAAKELIVAYDPWPPFTDDNDPNLGICFAITNAVFKPAQYNVIPRNIPVARTEHYLRHGIRIDASPYIWYSKERAEVFLFSEPFLYNSVHFFVRADSTITYERLEDLKPYTIGVIRNYYNGEAFDNASYLKKEINNTNELAIKKLYRERFEVALIDRIVAQTIMKRMNIQGQLKMLPKPVFKAGLHFVVSKKNPEGKKIIRAFDDGLARIKASGEYDAIMTSYGVSGVSDQ